MSILRSSSNAFVATVLALTAGACSLDADGMGGASFGSVGDSAAGDGSSGGENEGGEDTGGDSADSDASASADGGDSGGDAGDAGDAGEEGGSEGGGSTSGAPGDDDGGEPPVDVGDCSNFTSPDQLFSFVNTERGQYAGLFNGGLAHSRYKGYPWQGEGHEDFTFASQFAWDDALAASAQAEAEALAAGANPQGNQQNGSNGLPLCAMSPFWIDGINTAQWKISLAESPADWEPTMYPGSCPDHRFALLADNQHARMGLHYHDFGGEGPAINKLGVGAALVPDDGTGECKVWWVLQFGP